MAGKPSLDINQFTRFLETARAIGCDESEKAFDEKLKAVVGPNVIQPDGTVEPES